LIGTHLKRTNINSLIDPAFPVRSGVANSAIVKSYLLIRHDLFMNRRKRLSDHQNTFSPALAFAQASSCGRWRLA
jgi:hypothetical protein